MEDALYDSAAVQRFVGLTARDPQPDATTTLRFGRLLERHHLGEALLPGITRHLAAQGLRLREGMIVVRDQRTRRRRRSSPGRPGTRRCIKEGREPEVFRD